MAQVLLGATSMYALRWGGWTAGGDRAVRLRGAALAAILGLLLHLVAHQAYPIWHAAFDVWAIFVCQQLAHDLTHNKQPRLSRGPVR